MRKRPVLTVKELIKYLRKVNPNAKVFLAPSIVNLDEPQATQEFILTEEGLKCVAIECVMPLMLTKQVTLGWAAK
jgi:hypothetical protein